MSFIHQWSHVGYRFVARALLQQYDERSEIAGVPRLRANRRSLLSTSPMRQVSFHFSPSAMNEIHSSVVVDQHEDWLLAWPVGISRFRLRSRRFLPNQGWTEEQPLDELNDPFAIELLTRALLDGEALL
jgi:hypothetical protein